MTNGSEHLPEQWRRTFPADPIDAIWEQLVLANKIALLSVMPPTPGKSRLLDEVEAALGVER